MFYEDLVFYYMIIVLLRYLSDIVILIWMFLVEYIYLYVVGGYYYCNKVLFVFKYN